MIADRPSQLMFRPLAAPGTDRPAIGKYARLHWYLTKDGDLTCLALYERHYSAYQFQDGRKRRLFCGPGEKIVLRTRTGDALFLWRKFIDASGQQGINAAVFRNESSIQASELIRQADAIADFVLAWFAALHLCQSEKASGHQSRILFSGCRVVQGWSNKRGPAHSRKYLRPVRLKKDHLKHRFRHSFFVTSKSEHWLWLGQKLSASQSRCPRHPAAQAVLGIDCQP